MDSLVCEQVEGNVWKGRSGGVAAILIMKNLAAFKGFQRSGKTLQHKIHQGIPTVKIQIAG